MSNFAMQQEDGSVSVSVSRCSPMSIPINMLHTHTHTRRHKHSVGSYGRPPATLCHCCSHSTRLLIWQCIIFIRTQVAPHGCVVLSCTPNVAKLSNRTPYRTPPTLTTFYSLQPLPAHRGRPIVLVCSRTTEILQHKTLHKYNL